MPSFTELHPYVQQDIKFELKSELNLDQVELARVVSEIVLVADITRAMPGMDQGYLAIVEDKVFGDLRARFEIAIVYGTQGSASGILANLVNYSIGK
jgi:hypothetical protein